MNQTVQTKPKKWLCIQRRLRSAWASAYFDKSIHGTKPLKMAVDWDWINFGNKWKISFHVFVGWRFYFKSFFLKKLCIKQLWSRSVGLSRHFFGPYMGPNCFQRSLYNFSWRSVKFRKTTFIRLKHSPQLWKVEGASVCVSICPLKKIS